ncbi:putative 7-carboxy-7-deazaguanine synthase QueE [[Clostridium] polysaccharolyticum]|uniref:7-carboxy-7-deazaguanine synthase n=1 Tax=[Clostridium] polysaccharolyticum TaxID=29364 RepID=A0A1I0BGA6_9FIRM|nr:putative 7-carboxy-7-deazaguanine synthase QueE [[Clostridium] polysaccharolyticum]SET05609.1 7-carboxy-7-deazaguanine synthase [[Clostridium] polysaccharolyticum]
MATYQVAEKFVSINGEGTKAGQLAVFIRFKGCNLSCSYCDTGWANHKDTFYESMTEQDILNYILETGVQNVTLTGGEPLLQKNIEILLKLLEKEKTLQVEIETNGSISIEKYRVSDNFPSFTMDYKLPDSKMEQKMCLGNMAKLRRKDTVKFVTGSEKDLERAAELIKQYDLINRCPVYLSPVFGQIEPEKMVAFMKEKNLNGVSLQLQMHKFIWNPEKRGV